MKVFFSLPEFDTQLLRSLSYTTSGGADIGECLTTAARIKEGDFDSWYEEWTQTADRLMEAAETSSRGEHIASAREAFLRASNYYRTALVFLYGSPTDPRLLPGYDKHVEAFERALDLFTAPASKMHIPYEASSLPGYFYSTSLSSETAPTIITGSGYDSTSQETYFSIASGALKRGYNVLCFDGPGQGAALIKHRIPMRPDWEKVITPVIDFTLQLSGVDPQKLALIGTSWGGMLAPRAAAFEHRLAALIVNPGQFNALEPIKRFFPEVEEHLGKDDHNVLNGILNPIFNDRMMAEKFQAKMWIHGVETAVELLKAWKEYNLSEIAKNISCPTLVCDAENEPLCPGQAKELYAALECPKDYILFKNSDGAGEHTGAGALSLTTQLMFDWLDDKVKSKSLFRRKESIELA